MYRLLLLLCGWAIAGPLLAAERPNIVWLTAEDMSAHLGCYGDAQARTPRLDDLARQSVRYSRAFATAPVCSPARSCLITGMYATSLGTQRLRSQFPVPRDVLPFPAYLRQAGYYCTNNVKTDYNVQDEAAFIQAGWDESSPQAHWRGRRPGQPFFAVFNFMTTHQSRTSVWPQQQFEEEVGSHLAAEERHNPARLVLPTYYPDTEESRRAWARYRDCITLMDKQVGAVLDQLAADSLVDDTIVFFFSDHGMGMPRGKRCLYDSGMHVPLMIRFPPKWAHLAPGPPGSINDRLVSFVDFAPTVLSLCGVKAPAHFQGIPFLGTSTGPERRYVYGARDRVDEAFDVARSVRTSRWLYIRNYMPHLSWMQPEGFSDGSTFRQEMKRLAAAGVLPPAAANYAAPRRPLEELYDTQADPHQVLNVAADPNNAAILERLRGQLRRWQSSTRDAGLLTEPQMWARLQQGGTPRDVALDESRYPLKQLLEAAEAVGRDGATALQRQWLLQSSDGVRYWAAVGLHAVVELQPEDRAALQQALQDNSPVVRIEAASALARHGETDPALNVLANHLQSETPEVVLHAARALQLLGSAAEPVYPQMQAALAVARQKESAGSDMAMFTRFSLEAALSASP